MNNLDNKIKDVKLKIKDNPLVFDFRLELIQYDCLKGYWEHALKNLDICSKISNTDGQNNKLFRNNIICEIQRKAFFNNELDAYFVDVDINHYSKHQYEIFHEYAFSQESKAIEKLEFWDEVIHEFKVTLNNNEVLEGVLRDTDDRIKNILEIFVDDKYAWISIHNIKSIEFYENQFLVDLIWRRAIITMQNGKQLPCFVPVRYFSKNLDVDDDDLILAKKTQWTSDKNNLFCGIGQKTFELNDEIDFGILDIKKIDYKNND